MSRLVLVGIDGMDWRVLEPMLDGLPALSDIRRSGYAGEMTSIFPPDSIPSWVSIFTGLDPSEHGVMETIDYFGKDVKEFGVDTGPFRGRTFWDLAGGLGKKVIVVNPFLAHPPWKVNGVMASGPVFISGRAMAYPEGLSVSSELPPLGGIVDFPEKGELASFEEKTRDETVRVVDYTLELMESQPWDLVFVSLLTLDRVFHFFWRYFDTGDPTHPGRSEHSEVIVDFHRLLEESINRLRAAAGEDSILMIVSDHGHSRRPPLFFNLNQLLLEHGYLRSRVRGPKLLSPRYVVELLKNSTLEILHRLDLEDFAYRVAHLLPWTRRLKKSDFMTDPSSNLATASEFGGNNPFGGVEISHERCTAEGLDYEKLRDEIIDLLLETKDEKGEHVFVWVNRREDIYRGPFIEKFPDLLYEMNPDYGTNWSLHLPLITVNPRHRKISGGHRENGVLIVGPLEGWSLNNELISPLNLNATVLNVLTDGDHEAHSELDLKKGQSFLEKD